MIEVRIRHQDESKAAHLCYWEPAELDGVTKMLMSNGVRDGDGDHYAAEDQFVAEIVVQDGEAYYEVVLVDR